MLSTTVDRFFQSFPANATETFGQFQKNSANFKLMPKMPVLTEKCFCQYAEK
jgi:hypothetical protein